MHGARDAEYVAYLSRVDFPAPRKPLMIVHGTRQVEAESGVSA
jgi:hypothetical protein